MSPTFASEVKSRRPDLCIFINTLQGGGAERAMIRLANGMAARGLAVDLAVAKTADGPYRGDISDDIRLIELGARRVIAALPGLVRYLRRERPTVLLSALKQAGVTAILAHKFTRSRTRLIISIHNTLSEQTKTPVLKDRLIWPLIMRALYPCAGAQFVAVSGGVAKDLVDFMRIPAAGVEVIYNPITVAPPSGAGLFAIPKAPFILAAGRLDVQKDFPTLLRAFARLRQTTDMRLVLLGEGPLRADLEKLARKLAIGDRVTMPGFSAHIHDYMRKAALFVMSSATEGFGNVLVEAMACGARVVSTDCPSGPAEFLENGKWGRLVPVGDDEALAKAMTEALEDPAPPDVRLRAAYFSVDRAVDRYLEVLGLVCE